MLKPKGLDLGVQHGPPVPSSTARFGVRLSNDLGNELKGRHETTRSREDLLNEIREQHKVLASMTGTNFGTKWWAQAMALSPQANLRPALDGNPGLTSREAALRFNRGREPM